MGIAKDIGAAVQLLRSGGGEQMIQKLKPFLISLKMTLIKGMNFLWKCVQCYILVLVVKGF
jgi:hypothetical protein